MDDALLPAAPYLTSDHAGDVLTAAVAASGGRLGAWRPTQVQYRPGRELTVQYAAMVSWRGGPEVPETLLAGTTVRGEPAGTLPLEADGLRVGVWRYPFDPALPGLADAVYADPVARLLGLARLDVRLHVVAYRPSKRAVVHALWGGAEGEEAYVKVVPPGEVAGIADRHARLLAGGLPVPEVLAVDEPHGLLAMRALPGEELRARLVRGDDRVPGGRALHELVERFAAVDLGPDASASPRMPLLDAAPRHAAMLRALVPEMAGRLDALVARIASARSAGAPGERATIHGDLHEAQLRIGGDGSIVGVLDVDDTGLGDPLDDLGRSVGHLVALGTTERDRGAAILAHAGAVRHELRERVDAERLDTAIAAALIGLSTGPFRAQSPGWRAHTEALLSAAEHALAAS